MSLKRKRDWEARLPLGNFLDCGYRCGRLGRNADREGDNEELIETDEVVVAAVFCAAFEV